MLGLVGFGWNVCDESFWVVESIRIFFMMKPVKERDVNSGILNLKQCVEVSMKKGV
jgi:hypothetical protein